MNRMLEIQNKIDFEKSDDEIKLQLSKLLDCKIDDVNIFRNEINYIFVDAGNINFRYCLDEDRIIYYNQSTRSGLFRRWLIKT